ncbi:hypothetical protein niasHT_027326 [Heterodera trifolii]|uniref:RING-type domain-containing protein n=1 Tax=Heterodera trifolii TaxID=157864 RepID=A0ABD2JUC1_9BILA
MSAEFPIGLLLLLFLSFSLSAFATFEFDGQQNLTDGQFLGGQIKNLELLQTKFMDRKLMEKFLYELSKKQRIFEALFVGEKKRLLRSDDFPPPFIAADEFECLKTKLNSIHANDPALSQLLNGLFAAEMRAKQKLESLAGFSDFSLLKELKQSVAFALLFVAKRRRIQLNKHGEKKHFDLSKKSLATLAMTNKRYLDTFNGIPSVVVGAKKLSEEERTECAICLCQIDAGTKVHPLPICKHMFHNECIEMWIGGGHNGCPICRQEILDMDTLSTTTANAQANNNNNNNSNGETQNEVIIEINDNNNNGTEQNEQHQEQTAIENDNNNDHNNSDRLS